MKMMQTIIAICVLFLGLTLCGTAWADGPPGPHKGGGPMFLSRLVQHNMMVQVLVSLINKQPNQTNQPVDAGNIEQQLKDQHLPVVLSQYNINPKDFHDAMRTQMTALIKLLADSGYITTEQSNKIQEKMDKFAQRHQLMTLLVQKGLADGTITQEQAQILLPRHH